jgi:hypothetical protein
VTPVKLVSHIQACLTPDLLKPDQRSKLTGIHPTEGHCAVAAEAAYHLLGGKTAGWVPVVLPRVVLGDNTHWWIDLGLWSLNNAEPSPTRLRGP